MHDGVSKPVVAPVYHTSLLHMANASANHVWRFRGACSLPFAWRAGPPDALLFRSAFCVLKYAENSNV